jgi:hypothetical protein
MALIVVKPQGVELPWRILAECFYNNSKGAGFMYSDPQATKIYVKKGYMHWKTLQRGLAQLQHIKDKQIVIVFSSTAVANSCDVQPFPLHKDDLRKLNAITESAIVSNGIIPMDTENLKRKIDAMRFVQLGLKLGHFSNKEFFQSKDIQERLSRNGSKFVVLDDLRRLTLIGEFMEHEGLFYSDASWRKDFMRDPEIDTQMNTNEYDIPEDEDFDEDEDWNESEDEDEDWDDDEEEYDNWYEDDEDEDIDEEQFETDYEEEEYDYTLDSSRDWESELEADNRRVATVDYLYSCY